MVKKEKKKKNNRMIITYLNYCLYVDFFEETSFSWVSMIIPGLTGADLG